VSGTFTCIIHGTVEHIAGPFSDEEQAKSEMNSQMDFGLFPEFKGYQWECREDSKGYGKLSALIACNEASHKAPSAPHYKISQSSLRPLP